MAARPAEERKRKASTALRALAVELHVGNRGRSNDLTKTQFANLLNDVLPLCSTPEQRRRADEAKALFEAAPVVLPPIPALPLVNPAPRTRHASRELWRASMRSWTHSRRSDAASGASGANANNL